MIMQWPEADGFKMTGSLKGVTAEASEVMSTRSDYSPYRQWLSPTRKCLLPTRNWDIAIPTIPLMTPDMAEAMAVVAFCLPY
jgi:hypothetical protein